MEINTLQATHYRGSNVYIRNFNNLFEYLVIFDGQLYTAHIIVYKSFFQSILGRPYTQKQLEGASKMLINTAQATVDYLLETKGKKKK